MKHFVFFGLLAALPAFAADPILPLERQAAWQGNVGIPGGIPVYPVCVNVRNGPFNAVGDGLHDDSQAIQAAIAACTNGGAVYLPVGTYLVSTNVIIPPGYPFKLPSIALRGDGPGLTTIALGAHDNEDVIKFKQGTLLGTPTPITKGLAQNSSSITVSNASGIKVGTILSISQLNDTNFVSVNSYDGPGYECMYCGENGQRCCQQFVLVTNVSGNVLGINPPLLFAYNPALYPQAQTYSMITRCGVESMTVKRLYPSTNSYAGANCVEFSSAAWCWLTNVETCWPQGAHVKLNTCFQCQIQYCYFHDGWSQCSGQDYGVWIFDHNSYHLIENSIFQNCRHSMIFEAGGAGCVFGYNFSTNPIAGEATTSSLGEDQVTHGAHPWFNLYEGNVSARIVLDYAHGSASHNTFFRENLNMVSYASSNVLAVQLANWTSAESPVPQTTNNFPGGWIAGPGAQCSGINGVDVETWNYSNSIVGCVFTTNSPGPCIFAVTNMTTSVLPGTGVVERCGYLDPGSYGLPVDPISQSSTYWHGNWDPINYGITWNPANPDQSIPNSLYLTRQPAWWGTMPWPPIGPDLSPMVGQIPAVLRMQQLLNSPLLAPGKLHIVKGS